jgi:hypothetical protein
MNQMLDRGLTNRDASLFFEKIGLQDPAQIAQQAENIQP